MFFYKPISKTFISSQALKESMKEVYIGADHAGFELKEHLKVYLKKQGYDVYDEGAFQLDRHDDYPDFGFKVAKSVAHNLDGFGILCCGSAQGMCIVANKVKGIRAVSVTDEKEAMITRTHNNANILCLAGWKISKKEAEKVVNVFLTTHFSNLPRHVRRLKKITKIEG